MWHTVNSQNIQNNTSNVTVYFAFIRTDYPYSGYNYYGNAFWSITADGRNQATNGWTFAYSGVTGWITIGSKTFTINHNTDGTKYLNYSAYAYFDVSPGELWFSGGGWLPKIPRYTSISAWDTYEIGDTYMRFTWSTADTVSEINCYQNNTLVYSVNPNSNNGTFTIGNLTENTGYNFYIRVKRKDSGLYTTSDTKYKITSFSTPYITNWVCTKQEINALTFNWSCNYNCKNIKILNNNTTIYERNINQSSGTIRLDPSSYSNIKPNTAYSLRIVATRSYGDNSASSNYISIKTLPYTIFDNSQTSFNIGNAITLNFKNYENASSTISFYAVNESNSRIVLQNSTTIAAGINRYTFTPSSSTLYSLCPNRKYIQLIIRCSVTWNSVEYYTEFNCTGYCVESECVPTFSSFTYLNTDTTISNVIGSQNMINSYGNLRVQIPSDSIAVAKNSSKISAYKLEISYYDTLYTYYIPLSTNYLDVGSLSASGNYVLKVHAIDSRGYSTSVTKTLNVYLYHKPQYVVTAKRYNDFENQILLDFRCYIAKVMMGTIQKNRYVQLKYKKWVANDMEPETYTTITSTTNSSATNTDDLVSVKMNTYNGGSGTEGVNYFLSLDNSTAYYIKFYITDTISDGYSDDTKRYTTYLLFIDAGIPIMGVFENGKISIGKNPDFNSTAKLQVASDINVQDKMGKSGNLLENMFIVSSTEPTNQLVGGIWFDTR